MEQLVCGIIDELDDEDGLALLELARRQVVVPGQHPDPRHMAVANGFDLLPRPQLHADAARVGCVSYRWSPDSQTQGVGVFRGLAHAILWRERRRVRESEAWALAAILAVPTSGAESPHASAWFVRAGIAAVTRWLSSADAQASSTTRESAA